MLDATPAPSGLTQLLSSPDVQKAIGQSGVGPDVQALLRAKGGDVSKVLTAAGVDSKKLMSQVGLPPEAGALLSLPKIFSGKRLEGKLTAGADAVQGLLNASGGTVSQIGGQGTSLLANALGVKIHAAGKIGGAAGTAAGQALLGPAGGAVGQAIGTFVGEGIRSASLALGIGLTAKQKRERREKNRRGDDARRIAAFQRANPDAKDIAGLYRAFQQGRISVSSGTVGSQKWHERKRFVMRDGKLTEFKNEAEYAAFVKREPSVLRLGSNKASQVMLQNLLDYESKNVKRVDPKKAQEDLRKLKQAVVAGLVTAANAVKRKGRATKPAPRVGVSTQAAIRKTLEKAAARTKKVAAAKPDAAVRTLKAKLRKADVARAKAERQLKVEQAERRIESEIEKMFSVDASQILGTSFVPGTAADQIARQV